MLVSTIRFIPLSPGLLLIFQRIKGKFDFSGDLKGALNNISQDPKRFSKQDVFPLLDMMAGVVENGSGRVIRRVGFNHPAGGKTGTTNDFKDSWFTGFTQKYSTSVWVGFDDNSPLIGPNGKGLTGAHAAAPIWGMYMKKIHKEIEKQDFELPEDVRYEQVNYHNGFFAPDKSKDTMRVALHSGVALPVKPTKLVEGSIKSININQTILPKRIDKQTPKKGRATNKNESPLVVASIPEPKPSPEKLETQTWYMLNLKKASFGQSERVPQSLLVSFLKHTRELAVNGKNRIQRARSVAIDHLYQTLGSLGKKTKHGYSLDQLTTKSEIAHLKTNSND